jgi:hypothetical protein
VVLTVSKYETNLLSSINLTILVTEFGPI